MFLSHVVCLFVCFYRRSSRRMEAPPTQPPCCPTTTRRTAALVAQMRVHETTRAQSRRTWVTIRPQPPTHWAAAGSWRTARTPWAAPTYPSAASHSSLQTTLTRTSWASRPMSASASENSWSWSVRLVGQKDRTRTASTKSWSCSMRSCALLSLSA